MRPLPLSVALVAALVPASCRVGANVARGAAYAVTPPPQAPKPRSPLVHHIVAKHSGLHLGIREGRRDEGADAIQWTETGGPEMKWEILPAAGGCVRFRALHSGLYLAVAGAGGAVGERAVQSSDAASPRTAWRLVPDGPDWFRVVSDANEQFLAIARANPNRGEIALAWTDSGGDEQRWRFVLTTSD